jgi:predicted SprT family Zn-dependent metalloprotease
VVPIDGGSHDPKEAGDKDYVVVLVEKNNPENSEEDEEEEEWVEDEDQCEFPNNVQNSSHKSFATGDDDDDDDDDDDSSVDQLVERTKTIYILSSDEEDENDASRIVGENQKPRSSRRPKHPPPSRSRASKSTFRRQREALSQRWMQDYDRIAFGGRLLERACDGNPKLTLKWSNKLRTTAGITRLTKEMRRSMAATAPQNPPQQDDLSRNYDCTAVIELSAKVLDQESRLRETLAHEMCHAAAWIVDRNARPAHGPVFRKWAKTAMRTLNVQVTTTHNYVIDYRYQWQCTTPHCPAVFQRHSRSIDVTKQVCGRCRGRLVEVVEHTKQQKQQRPASAYNLFVQAEAQRVRQRLESLRASAGPTSTTTARAVPESRRHAPVMQAQVLKECARLWQSQKESGRGTGE